MGKSSINGPFPMAMLVITRGYMIYRPPRPAFCQRPLISTEATMPVEAKPTGKLSRHTIRRRPGRESLRNGDSNGEFIYKWVELQ